MRVVQPKMKAQRSLLDQKAATPTDLENTGSTDSDNAGTGDNSLSDTEDGDQQGNDPTGSQGDGQQDGDLSRFAGQCSAGQRPDRFAGRIRAGQPQVSFDIVGRDPHLHRLLWLGELTLTAQPLETEQQEAASPETAQPNLSYTIEAASQNRESTGTIYTRQLVAAAGDCPAAGSILCRGRGSG